MLRARTARVSTVPYRRSPGLVFYWDESRLVCFDCISGRRYAVAPEVLDFLHHLGDGFHTFIIEILSIEKYIVLQEFVSFFIATGFSK